MMKNKIGINQNHEKDSELIKELLDLMHVFKLDYTNTFIDIERKELQKFDFMKVWYSKLKERKKLNSVNKKVNNSNPKIIPRNHIIENILNDCEEENYNNLNNLSIHLKNPYFNNIPNEYMREPSQEEKVHQTYCGT